MLSSTYVSVFLVVSFPLAFLPITYTRSSSLPQFFDFSFNYQFGSSFTKKKPNKQKKSVVFSPQANYTS
jgi:hypothetical protein